MVRKYLKQQGDLQGNLRTGSIRGPASQMYHTALFSAAQILLTPPPPAGCLGSSTCLHEAAHHLSLSSQPGAAPAGLVGFVSCFLLPWFPTWSFPSSHSGWSGSPLQAGPHMSQVSGHPVGVLSSGQVLTADQSDLLPVGRVAWITAWMLGVLFINFMVFFVLYPLQISLMELKKNVYCLLWMATPTARGKSR